MHLDKKDQPVGEPKTDFEKGDDKGPFQCGNCVHMKGPVCVHPVMVEYSKQPRDKDGYPKVDHDDCCQFVRRPGKSVGKLLGR